MVCPRSLEKHYFFNLMWFVMPGNIWLNCKLNHPMFLLSVDSQTTPKFNGLKQWRLFCSWVWNLGRAWRGLVIFTPLGFSRKGLKTDDWHPLKTQVFTFGWHWPSAEMKAEILTHGFFTWVLTFLKVRQFGSKGGHHRRTRQKLYPFYNAALKVTAPLFSWSQISDFPDSKRENTDALHSSTDTCQHHTIIRALRMGYTSLWLSLENTLLHPKIPSMMMKTGRIPIFGKTAEMRQQIVVPCLIPLFCGQNSQGIHS